jgi:TonB-linked SusC/RagA family outer membrane protein
MLLIGLPALVAQQTSVSGTVLSGVDGLPLIGASVVAKGSTVGTITDLDGKFRLSVPESTTSLVFSYVGMKTSEVLMAGQTTFNVTLQADVLGLEEVVVVAYGVQKKEAKTGSVAVVSNEALQDIPETSVDKMLSGKVAGVVISATSGQPGSNSEVRIRGISSILAGTEPLYVIDGIPVMEGNQSYFTNTGNVLASLNPNDIESISVLKDAAASSIYGSRAANGVILITTKSGKSGASKVNFRVSSGFDNLANDNNYGPLSPSQYLTWARDAVTNAGGNPDDPSNPRYYYPLSLKDSLTTDWMDVMTRTGKIYNAELSVEGGNDKVNHYFSGSYEKNEGTFYGIDYERFQARTNIDYKVSDKLKMGTRINASHSMSNDVSMQGLFFVNPLFALVILSPYTRNKNEDGTYNLITPVNANTNPRATAAYDDQWEKQNRFNGNIYLEYKLLKDLTFKTTNNYELTDGEGRRYWDPKANYGTTLGTLQVSRTKYTQMTTSNTLTYNKAFGKHTVQGIAGQEATKYEDNSYYISSPDVDPNIPFPTTATPEDDDANYAENAFSLLSYFGILYYNYDNRYFLQASIRNDGSSRFGKDTRWGTFWSFGLSWNLHNEAFLQNLSFINQLKIRASYGLSGNYNIGNYEQYGLYGSIVYNGLTGFAPTQPANPNLGWEDNKEYNIGIDFAIFDKLSGSVDMYNRITEDMLLDYPLSRTSGFTDIKMNIGKVKNTGYEILLNYKVVSTQSMSFDLGFNIAHNNSEILDLGKDDQFINPNNNRIVHKVGEHLYSFYLYDYAGVNPANGEALWRNADGELTNRYSQAKRYVAGTPEPKFTGGVIPSFSWKGLQLDVNLEFKTGHQVLIEEQRYVNGDGNLWLGNQANTAWDYWKEPGQIARNPKPIADNGTSSYGYRSTRWMFDGDYLRIKNITLGYTLPKSLVNKVKLDNLRIYASAVNLYTFHKVDYWDPERGVDGTGFGLYPLTKKFVIGIEMSF